MTGSPLCESGRPVDLRPHLAAAALLRAGADLLWDAGPDGVIRITQVFHGQDALARQLDGRGLDELSIAGGSLRVLAAQGDVRARLARLSGQTERISVTCCRAVDGRLQGSFAGVSAERVAIDAFTLDSVMQARVREERLRRETEAMMLGLRLLLSEISFREKLDRLAHHLARAIGCDEVRLAAMRGRDAPRLVSPQDTPLHETLPLRRILEDAQARIVTVLRPDSHEAHVLQATLAMRAGAVVIVALPAPGERFYLLCRARTGLDAGGEGMAERIALLLQQALVLQDDQARMVHAAKLSALGQMSTSIAHELRQPLNTISIAAQNLELLAERGDVDPDLLREKSARILGQVARACAVMDRMRRFGRKTIGQHQPTSLAAIVRGVRALMDTVLAENGIALEIAVDDTWKVMADALEIEQVLVNLIQNAADAIQEHHGQGRIVIRAQDDPLRPDMLRLVVEDSGPGFAADTLNHALDAFFTTKPEGKGTGLGLSIAHAILREHGGRLLVGNAQTGGAVTGGRVTLVLRRAPPKPARTAP